MYHHPTGTEPSFYQPMLLPAALQGMQQALVRAPNSNTRHKAAIDIIQQYCDTYEPETIRRTIQWLLNNTLSHPHNQQMAGGAERHNLLLFYEFTMMMLDALYVREREEG